MFVIYQFLCFFQTVLFYQFRNFVFISGPAPKKNKILIKKEFPVF